MKIVADWTALAAQKLTMEGLRGVTKRVPIGPADGTRSFAMRVFTVEPGGYTPLHRHDHEHEIVILEGSGLLVREGGEEPVRPGVLAYIAPNDLHQLRAAADQPLSFCCLVMNEHA